MKDKGNLVWIDLEMTGLNPERERVLEVATIITNSELDILAEGPVIVIHQPKEVLASMDSWNTEHHRQSGLFELSCKSTYDCRQAELETLDFIRSWVEPQISPMCGNSIGHDRLFLARYMPDLENYFHYRNIDVSTVKELAKRWAPSLEYCIKEGRHRAYDDIYESIAELKHYRAYFIKRI
jgi:oligoribonuclease